MDLKVKLIALFLAISLIPLSAVGAVATTNMGSLSDQAQERSAEQLRGEITNQLNTSVEARQNGTISQARYRAEMAALAARTTALGHQLNQTETASRDLDAALLEERGVDASAIDSLRTDARNLTGPEVAEIARSIAGRDAGGGLDDREDAPARRPTDDSEGDADDPVEVTIRTTDVTGTRADDAPAANRTATEEDRDTRRGSDTPELPVTGERTDVPPTDDPPSGSSP